MIKPCEICGRDIAPNNRRLGVCWDCANFESILDEGVNMDDVGLKKDNEVVPAKTAREKMLLLKSLNLLYKKEISYIRTTTTTTKSEITDNFFKNWKLLWWFLFVLFGITVANVIIGIKII